ncbi:MAG: acyltransferase domain-containing protein [Desulfobacterales bacterium]|nr:acyltransferase domain-containing protein [Desulfobacterales bacterium]
MQPNPTDFRALMTKSLVEIKDLKARLKRINEERNEPIAVIGMACRFPGGANSPEKYWNLLKEGIDAIRTVPSERWDIDRFYDPNRNAPGKICSRDGGFIDDIKGFDASFFGISPREAESLDPHQRMVLELSWEALEHANIVPETLFGSNVGVFIGVSSMDNIIRLMGEGLLSDMDAYYGTGCALSPIAGRISYNFGFTGPSFVVDTACSSSLLSLHLAVESLRLKECEIALAGGIHLLFHPGISVAFSQAQMLSPDGRCKTFDAAANGYVRGEGGGIVVLKRLSHALRDQDNILALIRGSAVNQDGASGGLTVPSGPSQEQVIKRALERSAIEPSQVNYIEAHGTGTSLGDPIEIGALVNVLGKGRTKANPLIVGSVKTNIGHLEASAGIASFIKVVQAIQHETIPPHLHYNTPNPLIPWSEIPIHIPTKLTSWPLDSNAKTERIAGISSFGFSGTNLHLIVSGTENYLEPALDQPAKTYASDTNLAKSSYILPLSARTDIALNELVSRYLESPLFKQHSAAWLQICSTTASMRTQFMHRIALVADDIDSARELLSNFVQHKASLSGTNKTEHIHISTETDPYQVAWLFTGQGAQYACMGHELYHTEPVFKHAMQECDRILQPILKLSLIDLLYGENPASDERLAQTDLTQPVLFAFEYALARVWMSFGMQPKAVMGHSVGEYVAACIAGVFSLEDGLNLISARARLMYQLPKSGAMAAILADAQLVEDTIAGCSDFIKNNLNVAAYNALSNTVISGSREAIEEIIPKFERQGIECRNLRVSHAFHSHLIDPMLSAFTKIAQQIKFNKPQIPIVSNLTGKIAGAEIAKADYWVRHARYAVRFLDSVQSLLNQGYDFFIEIGPAPILIGMAQQIENTATKTWIASLRRNTDPRRNILNGLAKYWVQGGEVDWKEINGEPDRKINLPIYPFQHKPYWRDIAIDGARQTLRGISVLDHPLMMSRLRSPLLREKLFESTFSLVKMPFLDDHRVFGKLVVAGATHLSLVLGAVVLDMGYNRSLRDVLFPQALVVPEQGEKVVQLAIGMADHEGVSEFRLISLDENGEQNALHAKGKVAHSIAASTTPIHLDQLRQHCPEKLAVELVYELQKQRHIVVGPSYRWLSELYRGTGEVVARLTPPHFGTDIPSSQHSIERYELHPGLIDSCFGALLMTQPMKIDETFIPFGVAELRLYRKANASTITAHGIVRHADHNRLIGDIHLYDEHGLSIADFIGIEGRRAARSALLQDATKPSQDLYTIGWQLSPEIALESKDISALTGKWLVLSGTNNSLDGYPYSAEALQQKITTDLLAIYAGKIQNLSLIEQSDFIELINSNSADVNIDGIIFLVGLHSSADLNEYERYACGSLLNLLKALASGLPIRRLLIVTRGSQSVLDTDTVPEPFQAALWGMGLVAKQELAELECMCVDLDPHADSAQNATELMNTLSAKVQTERLAWRNGNAYLSRLEKMTDRLTTGTSHINSPIIKNTYTCVITGGLGALGMLLTEWLISKGAKHIALLDRYVPASDSEVYKKIEAWRSQSVQSVQLEMFSTDVSDFNSLQSTFMELKTKMPVPGAIFHLAGRLDDGIIVTQNVERIRQVMAPKADGAWNLHRLTENDNVEYFICFSSISSILGSIGQISYSAANSLLDALAHHRRAKGQAGLSINWGPFADVGMAARVFKDKTDQMEKLGIAMLHPQNGLQELERLMGLKESQIAVIAAQWSQYIQHHPSHFFDHVARFDEVIKTQKDNLGLLEQLANSGIQERRTILTMHLKRMVAAVLKMNDSDVAARERLFDLGLDSVMALELKNLLQKELQIVLSATLLFDYPTIESLLDYLLDEILIKKLPKIQEIQNPQSPNIDVDSKHGLNPTQVSIDTLSEDEAEDLLLAQLDKLENRTE